MIRSEPQLSRRLIFGGFAILVLSGVVTFINLTSQNYFSESGSKNDVQLVLATLSGLFAAGGWWFLCQLNARDTTQQSLLAKAYVGLGLEFSASCVAQLLRSGHVIFIDRFSAPFWLTALGFGVGATGFFLTAFSLKKVDPVATD